jgi:hypothetical protein
VTLSRMVIRIDEIVIDASEGADPATIAEEVRAGIAGSFAEGTVPRAFLRDAPLLRATHEPEPRGVWSGLGATIAQAAVPRRQP